MKITKNDLCSFCREIRSPKNDGGFGPKIEEWLDSKGYNQPNGYITINPSILHFLEEGGACSNCINLFKTAIDSNY